MSTPTPTAEAKHTPGPWSLSPSGLSVTAEGRSPICPIAWTHDTGGMDEEKLANARLIAAAPALLAALEAIIAYQTPLPAGLLEQARAALLQAKGGTR